MGQYSAFLGPSRASLLSDLFLRNDAILAAILNRLSQVTPADSHGCLLDACIEATEQYE